MLPLTMLATLPHGAKLLMLEPRRIAAKQIACRMADILGEKVGQTVGYRVRFENRTSSQTRIEVLTEGVLTRMLVDDPTLDGVGMVVFDEYHERSLNSDLDLALVRQLQGIIRPDLKIVVMSATIDTTLICHELNAPLVESQGRMYHVDIVYSDSTPDPRDIATAAARTTIEAHSKHSGDILVFLPGQSEIERCQQLIAEALPKQTDVLPLYANLRYEQQQAAIAPSADGRRKVVIATPIAETSLTIEGVRVVIDSGLCRQPVFDARNGMSHLATARISMDMAVQRAGRAGRVAEGVCYRLWTRVSEHLMAQQRTPEILESDLAPMLLDIAAFGESNAEALPWLQTPPHGNVVRAHQLLVGLGALSTEGTITPEGRKMSALPCHPRMARMITSCDSNALKAAACDIAAMLEEKDPLTDTADTDLSLRITMLRKARHNGQLGRWRRIALIAEQYRRMVHTTEDNSDVVPDDIGMLTAYAYPERIAKACDSIGGYKLAGGECVRIDQTDTLTAYQWIAVAALNQAAGTYGRVFLAAPLNPDCLDEHTVSERDIVAWDSKAGYVVTQRVRRVGKLTISSKPIHNTDAQTMADIVCEAMKKDGLSMMAWSDSNVALLQRRVAQVASWHPELGIPDISTPHLTATAKEWLPLYIVNGSHTITTSAELHKLNLADILWNIIPYNLQNEIDRLAPTHIVVPTGSHIRVDYRAGAESPILSVRLQECFGMTATPCVDNGRRPLLMELLSPGFKPVQLTQDLASFWKEAYFEVRKELRRRYPKHYWPENPLEAEAVRGVKRH